MDEVLVGQHRSSPGAYCRIKVKGVLDASSIGLLGDIHIQQNGKVTTLVGYMNSRTALHNLLARLRQLGLQLLLVQRIRQGEVEFFLPRCMREEHA